MVPVAWFVALTFALGIDAPVESTTAPVMAPCSAWPKHIMPFIAMSNAAIRSDIVRDILSPSSIWTANTTLGWRLTPALGTGVLKAPQLVETLTPEPLANNVRMDL